jgi:hypothetical protein
MLVLIKSTAGVSISRCSNGFQVFETYWALKFASTEAFCDNVSDILWLQRGALSVRPQGVGASLFFLSIIKMDLELLFPKSSYQTTKEWFALLPWLPFYCRIGCSESFGRQWKKFTYPRRHSPTQYYLAIRSGFGLRSIIVIYDLMFTVNALLFRAV